MNYRESNDDIKSGLRRGDHNSYRILYEKYYTGLCQLAFNYTGRTDIAEDIVQETILNIWKNRKELKIRGELHSYLYAAVRNGSINYLKHLMIERRYNDKAASQLRKSMFYMTISQEDGSSILIAEEIEKNLEDAINSLPLKCREIFLLNRKTGLKHMEIAQKLGISKNTVQKQISIAIKKLTNKLLPEIDEKSH